MKKIIYSLSIFVFSSLVPLSLMAQDSMAQDSKGGVFIEPMLTYESGQSEVNYPSPFSNSTGDIVGFGLGARVGLHLSEILLLGLDGRYSQSQFKDSSVQYDAKATSMNIGPVVVLQMPDIGFRFWGTYILNSELNPKQSGSLDVKFKDGKGYRLGTGFHVGSISLNLEYQEVKYDQATLEQIGPFASSSVFDSVDLEYKSWIASISFPIEM